MQYLCQASDKQSAITDETSCQVFRDQPEGRAKHLQSLNREVPLTRALLIKSCYSRCLPSFRWSVCDGAILQEDRQHRTLQCSACARPQHSSAKCSFMLSCCSGWPCPEWESKHPVHHHCLHWEEPCTVNLQAVMQPPRRFSASEG